MGRYKLHCFQCGHAITRKRDVWRNEWGYPACRDCVEEYAHDNCDDGEFLFDAIRDNGQDARKFPCDKCIGCDDWIYHMWGQDPICDKCNSVDHGACEECQCYHESVSLENRRCPKCQNTT